jgi:hypothetical protein
MSLLRLELVFMIYVDILRETQKPTRFLAVPPAGNAAETEKKQNNAHPVNNSAYNTLGIHPHCNPVIAKVEASLPSDNQASLFLSRLLLYRSSKVLAKSI